LPKWLGGTSVHELEVMRTMLEFDDWVCFIDVGVSPAAVTEPPYLHDVFRTARWTNLDFKMAVCRRQVRKVYAVADDEYRYASLEVEVAARGDIEPILDLLPGSRKRHRDRFPVPIAPHVNRRSESEPRRDQKTCGQHAQSSCHLFGLTALRFSRAVPHAEE
jgi:hypothetical protein